MQRRLEMAQHQTEQLTQPLTFQTLRGLLVIVREAVPADTSLLASLLGQLSKRTLQLRYMSARPPDAGGDSAPRRLRGGDRRGRTGARSPDADRWRDRTGRARRRAAPGDWQLPALAAGLRGPAQRRYPPAWQPARREPCRAAADLHAGIAAHGYNQPRGDRGDHLCARPI